MAIAAPASVRAVSELTDEDINVLIQPVSFEVKIVLKFVMTLLSESKMSE